MCDELSSLFNLTIYPSSRASTLCAPGMCLYAAAAALPNNNINHTNTLSVHLQCRVQQPVLPNVPHYRSNKSTGPVHCIPQLRSSSFISSFSPIRMPCIDRQLTMVLLLPRKPLSTYFLCPLSVSVLPTQAQGMHACITPKIPFNVNGKMNHHRFHWGIKF